VICAPSDENECRQLLYTAYQYKGPAAVRYPRGQGNGVTIEKTMVSLPLGKGRLLRGGSGIAILAFGTVLKPALEVAEQLNASVVDMRFVKPLDEELICRMANTHQLLVTVEENEISGGAGSGVTEFLNRESLFIPVLQLGLPDYFVEHALPQEMLSECGLDKVGILNSIEYRWREIQAGQLKKKPAKPG